MAELENTPKKQDKSCNDGHGCCSGKMTGLTLVLLAGVIGYLVGSHGGYRHHGWHHGACGRCPMGMMASPSADQGPASK